MIIDSHSHIWPSPGCLGQAKDFSCLIQREVEQAQPEIHQSSMDPAGISFVLGFVCRQLEAEIPNTIISKYVKSYSDRLFGFAGIDPADSDAVQQLRRQHDEDGFVGFTLSPACQGFHPCDTRAMLLYELAQENNMPVYFLYGMRLPETAHLEYAQPLAIDEIARSFPSLKIIISHMGFPWVEQTISLLAKHSHIYADVAGLSNSPWLAYRSLALAYECRVIEKLFFASDFPNDTVKNAVESLFNLNKITLDSVLPAVPREHLRGIVERDTPKILGLFSPTPKPPSISATVERTPADVSRSQIKSQ
jgi:predicted TIM-barrel fold metal-dependent hydrolase